MRRRLGPLLVCALLVWIGATPTSAPLPGATATPLPLLTPTPGPAAALGTPTVVVFPFDVENGLDAKVGVALAQITAQEMAASGGLDVLPVPSGIKRVNFLSEARKLHAGYYISGYVTPVGDIAAVVEQLVTVDSGIIIFSQTAQIATVADAASQALVQREAILAHAGILTQNVAPTPGTPAPSSNAHGASMKIGGLSGIVDAVFGHHAAKHGTSPVATPAVKPSRGVIVTQVTGAGLAPSELNDATALLYRAIDRFFRAQMTAVVGNPAQQASAMCGTDRNMTIAGASLASKELAHHKTEATVTLTIYACFGATLTTEIGKGPTVEAAITQAVAAYARAHPDNS